MGVSCANHLNSLDILKVMASWQMDSRTPVLWGQAMNSNGSLCLLLAKPVILPSPQESGSCLLSVQLCMKMLPNVLSILRAPYRQFKIMLTEEDLTITQITDQTKNAQRDHFCRYAVEHYKNDMQEPSVLEINGKILFTTAYTQMNF